MRGRNRMLAWIAVLASWFVMLAVLAKPTAKKHEPQKSTYQSGYERLLPKYLSRAEELDRRFERRLADGRRDDYKQKKRAGREVDANEEETLAKLRAEARDDPGGKLDFGPSDCDEPGYESTVECPTSPASARIFARLYKEGLVDTRVLLQSLVSDGRLLCPQWIALVQEIHGRTKPGSHEWVRSAFILYEAGVSREQYRPVLERLAEQKDSWSSLRALFFETNGRTGEVKVVKDARNLALFHRLTKTSTSTDVLLVCAEYAAETGQAPLAESICLHVLNTPYKGLSHPDRPTPKEDYALATSRERAMRILFYKVRTEAAFRAVYNLSYTRDLDAERERHHEPKPWVSPASYGLGRLEIGTASSLIDEIDR